jgi:predicted transcriptional regulator
MSVENILTVFQLATPEEIEHGVTWYASAHCQCLDISENLDLPLNVVVGVVAALSPNNKWERNVENARDLCTAYINGDSMESVKVSTYGKMKEKAWSILESNPTYDETIKILNGQKIVCFYQNIMGENTCTVDGHAYNIYHASRQSLTGSISIGKIEYHLIQDAYRKAGQSVLVHGRELTAYEMQAVTWVAWRRIHNIK